MLATLVLASALSSAQVTRLDAVMRYVMHDRAIRAMAVGIVRDGAVTIRAYGDAGARSLFPIGSLSKGFVAACALRLADTGTLSLDTRVAQIDARFAAARNVTLAQLLTHASGIPDYAQQPGFDRSQSRFVAPRDLIAPVAAMPLRFAPGSDNEYSNTNYVLSGLAVERAAQVPLIVEEHRALFDPLHMRATRRYLAGSHLYGAGDLESNAEDMTRWLRELLAPTILTRRDVTRMTSGVPYGMGFFAATIYGMPAAVASGYIPHASSFLALIPSRKTGVVLLSNADRVDLGPAAKSALAATLDIPE